MSLSSVSSSTASTTSTTSTITAVRKSKKFSEEYRALRQQFFHLQTTHANLKMVHEREMILAGSQRAQLQQKVESLQVQLDECRKDQVFILNSEQEIKKEIERVQEERGQIETQLNDKICKLERELSAEKERNFSLESELKLAKRTEDSCPVFDVEIILKEWKERVIHLTNQNRQLELQLEKTVLDSYTTSASSTGSASASKDAESATNEELRRKLLSTFVSLESAQSVLNQRKLEADRLAARIGNVKILEEKYRDAQIRIKRLETELEKEKTRVTRASASAPESTESSSSASTTNLKLIQLTQEIGSLKESLALASLNYQSLQTELAEKLAEINQLKNEAEETRKSVAKLQNLVKVKDSTIYSLKEQLDSTVNLLTETLKKKQP